MKLSTIIFTALAVVPGVLAVDEMVDAIIYWEEPLPPKEVMQAARDRIRSNGGDITHEYSIIHGFAVHAPKGALKGVQAWSDESSHRMIVEEDEGISINS
ncbi:hypothetical protein B0I35DRAFT_431146 [Stachybotrys elegans]|uniref:Inhibitor I9 domain-containing protein n=1 Tax=Stachybotrys elegans TaxID=80388 RepID=A0A8K0SUS7_9HYPO|nr:hypothetical protein B0I35DRAFT_431146 [Stachybotrys elegans]